MQSWGVADESGSGWVRRMRPSVRMLGYNWKACWMRDWRFSSDGEWCSDEGRR